jgi:hypothetical protein
MSDDLSGVIDEIQDQDNISEATNPNSVSSEGNLNGLVVDWSYNVAYVAQLFFR